MGIRKIYRLDFVLQRERIYAQTGHVPNITLSSVEDSVDHWIVPEFDNVLFEGDENMSAFLLGDDAL